MLDLARAELVVLSSRESSRGCLRGVVDIRTDTSWLGVASVFAETPDQVYELAYNLAEQRAIQHNCRLEQFSRVEKFSVK